MVYGSQGDGVSRDGPSLAKKAVESAPGLRRRLLQWLLPCPCLACGAVVWEPSASLGLCDGCRGEVARWPRPGCAICSVPVVRSPSYGEKLLPGPALPEGYRCQDCRDRPPPYDRLLSTWCYQPPLDETLMALKFRRLDYLGRQLGRAMAALQPSLREDADVVVPVPLFWFRRLTRGFNQAEIIARALAEQLGLPCEEPLRRTRPTPHQSRLDRPARLRNLRRAFQARGGVRGRRFLLVDDVVTTGATLTAASACLKTAGAASVVALTAARAVPRD